MAERHTETGQDPEPEYGAVNVPIFQTSTYVQPGVGKPLRYDYARGGNPTREALETVLASLEGGTTAFSYFFPPDCIPPPQQDRRCPVLYLLHGFGGDHTSELGTGDHPSAGGEPSSAA